MWYLLKVDALVAAFVFSAAGLLLLPLFVWEKAKAYAVDLHRLYMDVWRPSLYGVFRSPSKSSAP